MIEDYSAARFWFDVVQVGGLVALGVYSWWRDREKITAKRFRALEDDVRSRATQAALAEIEAQRITRCEAHTRRVTDAESAVSRVGAEIRQMPSREELRHLAGGMAELSEKLGKVEGRLDGINRMAELMNEFLINQGGRR
jgi:hypothetical protein